MATNNNLKKKKVEIPEQKAKRLPITKKAVTPSIVEKTPIMKKVPLGAKSLSVNKPQEKVSKSKKQVIKVITEVPVPIKPVVVRKATIVKMPIKTPAVKVTKISPIKGGKAIDVKVVKSSKLKVSPSPTKMRVVHQAKVIKKSNTSGEVIKDLTWLPVTPITTAEISEDITLFLQYMLRLEEMRESFYPGEETTLKTIVGLLKQKTALPAAVKEYIFKALAPQISITIFQAFRDIVLKVSDINYYDKRLLVKELVKLITPK